jgi:hypothetical protein
VVRSSRSRYAFPSGGDRRVKHGGSRMLASTVVWLRV